MTPVELCFTGLMADEIVTGGIGAQRKDADRKGGGPRYLLFA